MWRQCVFFFLLFLRYHTQQIQTHRQNQKTVMKLEFHLQYLPRIPLAFLTHHRTEIDCCLEHENEALVCLACQSWWCFSHTWFVSSFSRSQSFALCIFRIHVIFLHDISLKSKLKMELVYTLELSCRIWFHFEKLFRHKYDALRWIICRKTESETQEKPIEEGNTTRMINWQAASKAFDCCA